jgi:hypothetical protein
MGKISSILSGVSGEHFVAAELSRRGYIASLTSKNTKGIDLLASNEDASKTIGIQVKTNQEDRKSWLLNEKCEEFYSDSLFYIFVNLKGVEKPDFYIVQSTVVAKSIKNDHQYWLNTPGKKGNQHQDTSMRMFHDQEEKYLDRWDLLNLNWIL